MLEGFVVCLDWSNSALFFFYISEPKVKNPLNGLLTAVCWFIYFVPFELQDGNWGFVWTSDQFGLIDNTAPL